MSLIERSFSENGTYCTTPAMGLAEKRKRLEKVKRSLAARG